MIQLTGQPGELRFTIEVTRADTGIVEKYEAVGTLSETQQKELENGGNPLDSGTERRN